MKKAIVLLLLSALLVGCGSSSQPEAAAVESVSKSTTESSSTETTPEETPEETPEATPEVTEEPDPTEGFTTEQKNAIRSAKDYLSFSGFSKAGLFEQLSSEYGDKYPVEVAEFAVQYLEDNELVDWAEQAIKSAESYLSLTGFSRVGLIDQLTSEYGDQFTEEEASAAVQYLEDNGLVDWNEQAVKSAESYLDLSGFSRQELFDQLTSEYGDGYTAEEAEYALTEVYDAQD